MSNNKNFYEKILVSKLISKLLESESSKVPLSDSFKYVQESGDNELNDFIWLSICGDSLNWEENLSWVCYTILEIPICQPGACPFSVSDETLNENPKYLEWFNGTWKPYLAGLVKKYSYVWKPRLESKVNRGARNIIVELESLYGENLVKSKSFKNK